MSQSNEPNQATVATQGTGAAANELKRAAGERAELLQCAERVCQSATAILLADEPDAFLPESLQEWRAGFCQLQTAIGAGTERIEELSQAKAELEALDNAVTQKKAELKKLEDELLQFAAPLGKSAFAAVVARDIPEQAVFAERLALDKRLKELRREHERLAAPSGAGFLAKAKAKAQQLLVSGKIMMEEGAIKRLDTAIGEKLLREASEASVECKQAQNVMGQIAKHRQKIEAAQTSVKEAKSARGTRKVQWIEAFALEKIDGAASFDLAIEQGRQQVEQQTSQRAALEGSLPEVLLAENGLPEDTPLGQLRAELQRLRTRLDEIGEVVGVDVTYIGGHPEFIEKVEGTLCLDNLGIEFYPAAPDYPMFMRISYRDILKTATDLGRFPQAYLEKLQAQRAKAKAIGGLMKFGLDVAGVKTGRSLIKTGINSAVSSTGQAGEAPANRVSLIVRLDGAKKKIVFDTRADSKETMEQLAQATCQHIDEMRQQAAERARAQPEASGPSPQPASPQIVACPGCNAKLRVSKVGTITCPKCGTKTRVPDTESPTNIKEPAEMSSTPDAMPEQPPTPPPSKIIGCPKCGTKLRTSKPGIIGCPKCGTKIRVPETAFPTNPAPQPSASADVPPRSSTPSPVSESVASSLSPNPPSVTPPSPPQPKSDTPGAAGDAPPAQQMPSAASVTPPPPPPPPQKPLTSASPQKSAESGLKKAVTLGAVAAGGAILGAAAAKALGGTSHQSGPQHAGAGRRSASEPGFGAVSHVGAPLHRAGTAESDMDSGEIAAGVPVDTDDDGVADAVAIDADDDGVVDAVGLDSDGDGVVDTVGVDQDGDGVTDAVVMDSDRDGTLDAIAADTDGDEIVDAVGLDTDGDGALDAVGVDTDEDEIVDAATTEDDDVMETVETDDDEPIDVADDDDSDDVDVDDVDADDVDDVDDFDDADSFEGDSYDADDAGDNGDWGSDDD